jgi:hypothetical protein
MVHQIRRISDAIAKKCARFANPCIVGRRVEDRPRDQGGRLQDVSRLLAPKLAAARRRSSWWTTTTLASRAAIASASAEPVTSWLELFRWSSGAPILTPRVSRVKALRTESV